MYIVYRDVITTLIFGLVSFTIMSITFSEAFVDEIQHCLPEAICCFITRFTDGKDLSLCACVCGSAHDCGCVVDGSNAMVAS